MKLRGREGVGDRGEAGRGEGKGREGRGEGRGEGKGREGRGEEVWIEGRRGGDRGEKRCG